MALDDTDRRRFYFAALLSLIALPALWFVNRDDPAPGPNIATAGVDVGNQAASAETTAGTPITVQTTIGQSNLPTPDTIRDTDPIFLDGPAPQQGGVTKIAVQTADGSDSIFAQATFLSTVPDTLTCFAKDIEPGQIVTVINLDNLRSTTCSIMLAPVNQPTDIVLHTDNFVQLADLTDAPISVQVRL
ncbi:hypothetical protein [Ilumatobacter sp.]|uniref:hypothetical protein n=1 Tax=Ilumatobacter sp. TaxID=1967498 RepID=UPI003750FA2B